MAVRQPVRRRNPQGPSKQAVGQTTGTRCAASKCTTTDTEYIRLNWWCRRHAPTDETPDPNCDHYFTVTVGSRTICSYCTGTIRRIDA